MTRPTEKEIRNDAAIPWASQIRNDAPGNGIGTVADALAQAKRAVVTGLALDAVNEKSVALGGLSTDEFVPTIATVQMAAVVGVAATGDVTITIGILTGGTEILLATATVGLIDLNDKFSIDLTGVVKKAMPANSTIFVKATIKDTSAGAGHLADVFIDGNVIPSA